MNKSPVVAGRVPAWITVHADKVSVEHYFIMTAVFSRPTSHGGPGLIFIAGRCHSLVYKT